MITDQIEVSLQSNLHLELCPAMHGQTLTFQQKAYLLPQNSTWKHYADAWLNQRMGDGTFAKTFKHHQAN